MGLKSTYFKLLETFFVNKISRAVPGMVKPFVLCYHQIDAKEFDDQLTALKKRFEIVDLETFANRLAKKQKGAYCALTLDDCLKEDVEKAAEVCRKHNAPITLFLPVRFSKNNEALPGTWVQKLLEQRKEFLLNGEKITITPQNFVEVRNRLREEFNPVKIKIDEFDKKVRDWFAENNITETDIITPNYRVMDYSSVKQLSTEKIFSFQSHTYNHESLGLCTPQEIEKEFADSKKELEELTGVKVFSICYPYGSKEVIGDKIFGFVGNYYTCGFSLVQGVCTKNTDIYFIPRIGIYPKDTLNSFFGKIYHHQLISFLQKI